MTPRDLLQAWLDLSENRALSERTLAERSDTLIADAFFAGVGYGPALGTNRGTTQDNDLNLRWLHLRMPGRHLPDFEAQCKAYWTARKQLERETRTFLETE